MREAQENKAAEAEMEATAQAQRIGPDEKAAGVFTTHYPKGNSHLPVSQYAAGYMDMYGAGRKPWPGRWRHTMQLVHGR